MKISIVMEALTGKFQTDMKRASKESERAAKQIRAEFKKVGAVVGASLAAGTVAVAALVKSAINDMDNLAKSAQRAGISVEELSSLQFVGTLAGVENMENGILSLTRAMGNALNGNKEFQGMFDDLKVKVTDANGNLRQTTAVMHDLADRFKSLPDGAEKTFIATKLRIKELLPLLNQGSEEISRIEKRLAELGLVVDTQTAKAAERFNDELTVLSMVSKGFWVQLATELLPDLERLTGEFNDLTTGGLAKDVADGIRSIGDAVVFTGHGMNLLAGHIQVVLGRLGQLATFNVGGLLTGAYDASSGLVAAGQARMDSAGNAAQSFLDFRQRRDAGGSTTGPTSRRRNRDEEQSAAEVREMMEAIARRRQEIEKSTVATDAAREATRKLVEAEREHQRIIDAGMTANNELQQIMRQQAELYDGPLEQAAREYADTLLDVLGIEERLNAAGLVGADVAQQLAQARISARKQYVQAQADIATDWIVRETEALDAELQRSAESWSTAMNVVNQSLETGLYAGMRDGFNAGWKGFYETGIDMINRLVAQALAKRLTESLFGDGTASATSTGGGWVGTAMNALSGLFGGGRATGGPVSAGKFYQINEREPEFFAPRQSGEVIPLSKMPAGNGVTVNQAFNLPPMIERKTADQVAMRAREKMALATRNS